MTKHMAIPFEESVHCAVCGEVCLDFYIVHAHVWKEADMAPEYECHLDCLSARLVQRRGRGLDIADFPVEAPINRSVLFGYFMGRYADEGEEIPDLPLRRAFLKRRRT